MKDPTIGLVVTLVLGFLMAPFTSGAQTPSHHRDDQLSDTVCAW
jgi:hypothetical protein